MARFKQTISDMRYCEEARWRHQLRVLNTLGARLRCAMKNPARYSIVLMLPHDLILQRTEMRPLINCQITSSTNILLQPCSLHKGFVTLHGLETNHQIQCVCVWIFCLLQSTNRDSEAVDSNLAFIQCTYFVTLEFGWWFCLIKGWYTFCNYSKS